MKMTGEIRKKVAEILTRLFGNEGEGLVFKPEDTIKRSGGRKRLSKYTLNNSVSWSAEAAHSVMIHCVGLTMTEFIKYFEKGELSYIREDSYGLPMITIYRNTPLWKTSGYVKAVDRNHGTLTLRILDLFDVVTAPICDKTPQWLLDEEHGTVSFTCKIHQGWRSLRSYDDLNWSKVWKTFKFDRHLALEDVEYF
jgi:hypothetical protein